MNPDDDEVYEDDQLLLDLMQMAQQAEDENPGRGLHTLPVRRERSESLEELLANHKQNFTSRRLDRLGVMSEPSKQTKSFMLHPARQEF